MFTGFSVPVENSRGFESHFCPFSGDSTAASSNRKSLSVRTSTGMGPGTEEPRNRSQTAPGGAAEHKRRRKTGGGRPKRRKNESGARGREEERSEEERARPGRGVEAGPTPAFRRVPFKSVLEAESILAYGDKRDATQKPGNFPESSAPQLKCQTAEILGPPSGPNLSFLPQIDKWLHVALQDANSYYRRKKYAIAASRFTAALELCSKGAVLGRAFDADYEDISKVTGFIQSKLVTCYLRMRRPDLALNHSHR
ncbi:hypothetical protein SKAU_G00048610 [Synaphobranchus kaupii]|uniref:Uncharacterized protein n=1 Tax=Synaphobranchus kaupii TaxID=118154 RepID=A0A9Q1J8F1_SYNKA|nr:hypothetical protein SKAU_G00048610 [Synaphobranchus kaupii]